MVRTGEGIPPVEADEDMTLLGPLVMTMLGMVGGFTYDGGPPPIFIRPGEGIPPVEADEGKAFGCCCCCCMGGCIIIPPLDADDEGKAPPPAAIIGPPPTDETFDGDRIWDASGGGPPIMGCVCAMGRGGDMGRGTSPGCDCGGICALSCCKDCGNAVGHGKFFLETQTIKCMAMANSSLSNLLSTGTSTMAHMAASCCDGNPDLLNKPKASSPCKKSGSSLLAYSGNIASYRACSAGVMAYGSAACTTSCVLLGGGSGCGAPGTGCRGGGAPGCAAPPSNEADGGGGGGMPSKNAGRILGGAHAARSGPVGRIPFCSS